MAAEYHCVIAVTGAIDYITDGRQLVKLHNGHPMMARVTGMGCTATALIGAFLAISPSPLEATVAALACLGVAGERASRDGSGPGSLQAYLLNELYQLNAEILNAELDVTLGA